MPNKSFYLVPVLVAGLVAGLPASLCCCSALLTPVAGLFAVYLVKRRSGGQPIEAGEGALIGALVGALTAIVAVGLQVVIRLSLENVMMDFSARMGGNSVPNLSISSGQGVVGLIIGGVVTLVTHVAMGVLGGALSTVLMKTGAGAAPPQNPF